MPQPDPNAVPQLPLVMPIMPPNVGMQAPAPVPWAVFAPHETQALINHSQNLVRLAQRGGLAPCEAVAILEGRRWHPMDPDAAVQRLAELVAAAAPAGHAG